MKPQGFQSMMQQMMKMCRAGECSPAAMRREEPPAGSTAVAEAAGSGTPDVGDASRTCPCCPAGSSWMSSAADDVSGAAGDG